tara:strand:+ start:1225 stop:1536 length:312 start_codon:yes stop_codon:yes gene_type:complete
MSDSNNAYVKFVEDEDIYIDCRPVSTYGGEVIVEDKDNNVENTGVSADMVDSVALNFSNGTITNNIGFQSLIGIGLLAILYGVGNYVFKEFPKNLIDKKLRQY